MFSSNMWFVWNNIPRSNSERWDAYYIYLLTKVHDSSGAHLDYSIQRKQGKNSKPLSQHAWTIASVLDNSIDAILSATIKIFENFHLVVIAIKRTIG